MDKQTNKTNLKVLAALGLMMTSQQVNAVAISSTEKALAEHRHKSHHHHKHHQERPDESDKVSLDLLQNQNPEQLAERRTIDVVREELQAELHNSDDEQENQEEPSEYSKPETVQEEEKPQQMAQFENQIEEYKPEPIRIRAPVQTSKTADLIAQAIIHQNQKAQGMTDDQIYGASNSAADESEFGFGSTTPTKEAQPIAEKIQQIEQKPSQPQFQMAEISEPIKDAQENAVQKTLKLIKERQASSNASTFVQKPKQLFPMFDKPVLATADEQEEIVAPIAPPKKVVIHQKQIKKQKPRVMNEEENAQAEVEAMLEVEKRQESARNKQVGGSLVQDSKPAGSFGAPLDMHIDSSIIDKVRIDTDKEMTDIDNEAQRTSVAQRKAEESSSEEEEEMTEQEKLYGRQEKPKKHRQNIQKPQPVQQKVEEPEVVPEVKPTYSLSQSTSAEDAKQMAVQKTLDLINKFKKNENLEQASISPKMSFPEPVQEAPIVHSTSSYNKDQAIQKILETIRQKHNLPPVAHKQSLTLAPPVAPKQSSKRSEIQEIQDKIDQTKLEMKKLPNAPEYGIETSKLDVDESEFVTKPKPQEIISTITAAPKVVETKKVVPKKQDTTFQIETTKMDVDIEAPKQEVSMQKVTNVKGEKKTVKPQTLQQKKTSEGNEYKIETTSVDMDSLKSIVGDTSDLDLEKVQAQELQKIKLEKQRQEKLRKEAEEERQEELRLERERLAAEKKAAEEEEERQRQEILKEQAQKLKELQQEEEEIKQRELKLQQEKQEASKPAQSLPLTVPVINNKDPKVSVAQTEKPQTIGGEIKEMNNNMRGMLKEIVETIQPALEESVGPDNSAKVKVVVTPLGQMLSQSESQKKSQEYTFDDTRTANAQSTNSAPISAPAVKETELKAEEKKPETQVQKPEAFPAAPVKAEQQKPETQAVSAPQPMNPSTPSVESKEKVVEPVQTEAPAGPSQSAIQNAIQATLSKIKADKSLEQKSVDDFKKETEKIEQERKETEAKNEAAEKVQKEKEEAEEKTKLSNLKDSVVANAIKAGKAKQAEQKALQEAIKKKQDQAQALAKQETENMNDLIKVGEATHKNPLISNVVANTIALMKKQKQSMNAGPFSHLFDTLNGEALMQQSESAKVTLPEEKTPEKTAVKSQLSNIKNAVKASVVKSGEPKSKSLIQLNEDPVDVRVKVNIDDNDNKGQDEEAEAKRRDEERAAEEKRNIENEAGCEKQRKAKDAQDKMLDAEEAAHAAEKKREKAIRAHDAQQAQDEAKERENEATGKRVDRQYKDGSKIVGITMDAATKAQENSADAVNAAGSAQIVDNRKPDDSDDKAAQAVKDAIDEKNSDKIQDQSSGELVKAKNDAKDIQAALDKVTYSEEKDKFFKEKEAEKVKEAQEHREQALKEQKEKAETARKEDEMRAKIVKETNDQIKQREEREAAEEKDREEAESLKKLEAFKEKQDKENKERKEREAQSKKDAEAQRKKDLAAKEKELDDQQKEMEESQKKMEEERQKFNDRQKYEKEQDEKEAREAQEKAESKAKYDEAFRDGEISKGKEVAAKEKKEAEKEKMQELQRKIWESKQNKDSELQQKLENEEKEQYEKAEKERKENEAEEKRLQEEREKFEKEKKEAKEKKEKQNNQNNNGGYQQPYNQGYGGPPQYQNGGYNNRGGYGGNNNYGPPPPQYPPQNNGYNSPYNHYDQESLVQKSQVNAERKSVSAKATQESKKVEERKSISTAQVVAQAPKATEVNSKAPVPAKVVAPVAVKLVEEKPKAVAAPVVVAKPAQASVAKVTPPKDNSQNKGTVLIQSEEKPKQVILDQKDEKDTELFNKADVQDENWLELTFHKIGMNVKNVFNKLFLPQLQSSNLSHQEKIELMMLWEEHHDQEDK